MLVAMCLSLLLCKPEDVRRADGEAIAIFQSRSFKEELVDVSRLVFDYKAMLLVPGLFVGEFLLILQPTISGKHPASPYFAITLHSDTPCDEQLNTSTFVPVVLLRLSALLSLSSLHWHLATFWTFHVCLALRVLRWACP